MAKLIEVSLCLSKLDKEQITTGKDGVTKYINLTISVNDEADQFNKDVQVWNKQTKEQSTAKVKKSYCGSGKVFWSNDGAVKTTTEPTIEYKTESKKDDGLPF